MAPRGAAPTDQLRHPGYSACCGCDGLARQGFCPPWSGVVWFCFMWGVVVWVDGLCELIYCVDVLVAVSPSVKRVVL
ncbi:hypothetical protein [Mycobacterium uberis]|uniref:hypothetical protein n=1 Tax=Mycobacterium uberis TaxID=2162698 RepID=UPI003C76C0FE